MLTLILCIMLVMSCSDKDRNTRDQTDTKATTGSTQPDEISSASDVKTLLGIPLPLDAFHGDSDLLEKLSLMTSQLIESCMQRRGSEYTPPTQPPRRERLINPYYQYFGEIDPDHAAKYGYKTTPEIREDIKAIEAEGRKPPPPKEYLDCIGEVTNAIGGEAIDPNNIVGQLQAKSITETLQSEEYRVVLDSWKECMRSEGIDPPSTPFDLIPKYGRSDSPSPEEIRVATADVACKSSSKLVSTFINGVWTVQERLVDDNAVQLDEVKQAIERERKRVLQLLQNQPGA